MEQALLERLKRLAAKSNRPVPPWLEDLLLHGPRFDQWSPMENRPNRVLLTEFVARWLKYAGVSHEEALEWLLDYCMQILIAYSKSGPSAVRHGTKANTRWVYKSDFIFDFEAMASAPVAPAFDQKPPSCPSSPFGTSCNTRRKRPPARTTVRPCLCRNYRLNNATASALSRASPSPGKRRPRAPPSSSWLSY